VADRILVADTRRNLVGLGMGKLVVADMFGLDMESREGQTRHSSRLMAFPGDSSVRVVVDMGMESPGPVQGLRRDGLLDQRHMPAALRRELRIFG